jgi:hypothetical protein
MTTLRKDKPECRDHDWRPTLNIDTFAIALEKQDPAYKYYGFIYSYKNDPNRISKQEDKGWEVVYSTQGFLDDRKFSPDNSNEEKLRPTPVLKTTSDGHKMVLMRIPLEKFNENTQKDHEAYEKRLKDSRNADGIKQRRTTIQTLPPKPLI